MRKFERLMAGVAAATLAFSAPVAAETSDSAEASEQSVLREEVKALQERLARLEQLLSEKLASEEADETVATTAGTTLQPVMNIGKSNTVD